MAYIIDYKTQHTSSIDDSGFTIEEPPLLNVKAGDLLVMAWGANTDAEVQLLDGFNLATHITSNETITSTSFTVGALNMFFQDGDVLQIGDEKILITSGAGDRTFNVQRAYDGTTAVAHSDNENIWKIDDAGGIGGADWKPVPHGCSTMDVCEAKMYYKFAEVDGEQVSTWTCPVVGTYMYMFTAAIRGVHPTDPFIDAGTSYYTNSANTQVSYPDLVATSEDQLALYVGSSDADTITTGSHGRAGLYLATDVKMYQGISSGVGSMGAFEDTVPSDQTAAIGVLFRDDPANAIIPLQITPSNSLVKIDADNTSDDTWMEAIYASGIDPKTGIARVNQMPNLEMIATTSQWVFRIDNGGTDWLDNGVIGETVTFGDGSTGKLGWIRRYQTAASGRAYMMVYDYNGGLQANNSTVVGSTSTASALIYSTGTSYQSAVTNYVKSDIKLNTYETLKISGCTGVGISDGVYFVKAHDIMNTTNEGYWYQLISHAERREDGVVQTFSVGTASPTLAPYHMINRAYTYSEGDTNLITRGTTGNQAGWKANYLGSFKSWVTPIDYSSEALAIWSRHYNGNAAKTYFCAIDSSNNWKIWIINNKTAAGFQYASPEFRTFDLNSTDTPKYQTQSFNSNAIKYIGFMLETTSDTSRDTMYMYDQYTLDLQTVRGGGESFGVPLLDIEKLLAVEETLNGQSFTEGLKAYTPTMLVASKTIRFSCYMGSSNQALGFLPQADGIGNFIYNVDGDSSVFGLEFTDAKGSVASLLTSDKGNFLKTGGTATVGLEGSTIANYNPTFQIGETITGVRFTGCGQISGGATLTNCIITGHTGSGGVLFDGFINGGSYSNNTYGVEIDTAGTYELNDATFSNNTQDINVTATTGTVTIITNVARMTYITAGAIVDIQAPETKLTLTGLQIGSDVVILEAGTQTVLASVAQGGTSFNYTYSTLIDIDIGVIKQGYITLYQYGYTLGSTSANLPITQLVDRNYV